jgi:hypothetical protein
MKTSFHNCIIPYKYEIKENYVAWLPYSYIISFRDEIVPKFLNKSISDDKRERWQNHIDAYMPKTFLGYASEETFLEAQQLTPKDIVLNSLKYIFNDELDADSYEILTDSFIELLSAEKVKILRENSVAIYKEIVDISFYIKQIQTVFEKYPLRTSEHKGTAHTTKFKSLIKTQINKLEDRLTHPYFPLTNQSEIEDTKMLLKLLTVCLDKERKNLPEYLNFINAFYGLESKILNLDNDDIKNIQIFLNFYNGIKTERIELVQSVAIYINNISKDLDIEASKKAELISDIIEIFFKDEIKKYNKTNNKRTFSYNAKSIEKESRVKTVLHETLIYAYDASKGSNIIQEMVTIGINSMLGIQNIFEPEKPTKDKISNIQMIRSLIHVKNEFKLSTHELRVMLHMSVTSLIFLEYSAKRKTSSKIITPKTINHPTIPLVN